MKNGKAKCLACKAAEADVRGVCGNCYASIRRAVRAGKTTYEKMQKRGLLLPARVTGRPIGSRTRRLVG